MSLPTGETDINGRMIRLGDTVRGKNGFVGRVVFANCAFRVDIDDGAYLQYNSSLLFNESGEKLFEIIGGEP